MLFWLVVILGIVFIYYFVIKKYDRSEKDFLIMAAIWIIAILGSRYFWNGFTDEVTYNFEYVEYSRKSFDDLLAARWGERDFGFYLVYWAMSQVVPWNQFPIYFITALFTFASFRFIYKNSDYPLISVLLLFVIPGFAFYMAAYRQCFATCFCLFAFEYAKRKKFVPYALLVAIACTMHISAVIFIPVYWLIRLKNNRTGIIVWLLTLIGTWFAENAMMIYASDVVGRDYTQAQEFSLLGFGIQLIIMLAPFILDIFNISAWRDDEKDKRFRTWILLSFGILFYFSKLYNYSFERVSYYYSFFAIVALANSCARVARGTGDSLRLNRIVPAVVIILLILLIAWRSPKDLTFFFLK